MGAVAAIDNYGLLPEGSIDDRRNERFADFWTWLNGARYPQKPDYRTVMRDPEAFMREMAARQKYAGTLASGPPSWYPPKDINNPLSQAAGVGDVRTTRNPLVREIWMSGDSAEVPVDKLTELYGPGEISVRGRRMP
jgi:hypothetical protein